MGEEENGEEETNFGYRESFFFLRNHVRFFGRPGDACPVAAENHYSSLISQIVYQIA
jgi:hypothetical protein